MSAKVDDSRYFARAGFDTLDSLGFPTQGVRVLGEYSIYDATLGATRHHDGVTLDILYPLYHNTGTTVLGQGYLGYLFETAVADVTPRYSLGGFTRLSGYSPNEISGRHAGLVSLMGYQRLNEHAIVPMDQPLFIGFSLEAGNVFRIAMISAGIRHCQVARCLLAQIQRLGPGISLLVEPREVVSL